MIIWGNSTPQGTKFTALQKMFQFANKFKDYDKENIFWDYKQRIVC